MYYTAVGLEKQTENRESNYRGHSNHRWIVGLSGPIIISLFLIYLLCINFEFATTAVTWNYLQAAPLCSPKGISCSQSIDTANLGCRKGCTGLYADMHYTQISPYTQWKEQGQEWNNMFQLVQEYKAHKRQFVRNIQFDPELENLSKWSKVCLLFLVSFLIYTLFQTPP